MKRIAASVVLLAVLGTAQAPRNDYAELLDVVESLASSMAEQQRRIVALEIGLAAALKAACEGDRGVLADARERDIVMAKALATAIATESPNPAAWSDLSRSIDDRLPLSENDCQAAADSVAATLRSGLLE